MLIKKKHLNVVGAASNDLFRVALNGVLVEGDGSLVACDGHILLKVAPAADDPKNFPAIEGCNPVEDEGVVLQPFILSTDTVNQLKKAGGKPSRYKPILNNIALDVAQTNANGNAVMAVTDLETPQVFRPKKVDGQFPDYTKAVPAKGQNNLRIGWTVEVLEKMVKTLKALDCETFAMEIDTKSSTDNLSPVRIDAMTTDSYPIEGAIMPCRLD